MAATVAELEYTSVSSDRTSIVITDVSVYDTPLRFDTAVFFAAQKMNYSSEVETTLTAVSDASNPLNDSNWTVTITKDGWIRFPFSIIPIWSSITNYSINDAIYYPAASRVYKSIQAGINHLPTDLAYWVLVDDPALLALNEGETNESHNIFSTVFEIIATPNSEFYFSNAIAQASTEGGDAERESAVQVYDLMGVWLDGMFVYDDRSQMPQGERIARRVQSFSEQEGLTDA